jgi:hypothetical protein
MTIDSDFRDDQITAIKAAIIAYNAAIIALKTEKSYTLDTGQTRQTVTNHDLGDLIKTRSSLYNELTILCNIRDKTSGWNVRPGW